MSAVEVTNFTSAILSFRLLRYATAYSITQFFGFEVLHLVVFVLLVDLQMIYNMSPYKRHI